MDVKSWVSIEPVTLWRADDVLERERIVETSFLREIEVSVVDIMVDSDEHLTLTGIHNRVVLCSRREVKFRTGLSYFITFSSVLRGNLAWLNMFLLWLTQSGLLYICCTFPLSFFCEKV